MPTKRYRVPVGLPADTVSHLPGPMMTLHTDELSSHRTRTNRRPEPLPATTAATAVLEPEQGQEPASA
ncbi:hypothetical protein GCM10009627_16790 [Curtobacterium herbarum]|uniref:Uncharacterized protein n=1 Tax=Curtobacterium herbarum TaxID=150122 RepID=A0ABN1ZCI1_9MICO